MNIEKGLLYTKDHEWLKVEGDEAYIGLSDYAQDSLGEIVYVELPEVDDEFEIEKTFSAIESVKAASDMYMPIDGTVVEVNEAVSDDPALLNSAPYENWIIKVKINDAAQLDALLSDAEYETFLAEEA